MQGPNAGRCKIQMPVDARYKCWSIARFPLRALGFSQADVFITFDQELRLSSNTFRVSATRVYQS
jgi:hypothetical protein